MSSVSDLPDDFFKFAVHFQVAFFVTLIRARGFLISSSSVRVALFVILLVLSTLSPVQVEKEVSPFDFTRKAVTTTSYFVVVLILFFIADRFVSFFIQSRRNRIFLDDRCPLVTSNSLFQSNQHHHPNWSNLPADMISEIADRLPNFKDVEAVSSVCNPWRDACLEMKTRRPTWPWLMFSDTIDIGPRRFLNMCDGRHYQIELPSIRERRCWGSPHGCVVALNSDYEIHIEHLIRRVGIALPPLNTIRRLAPREEWFCLVHNFNLFKDPSHKFSFLVTAIFGPMKQLAFARVASSRGGEGEALSRGHGEWAIVNNPKNFKFKDVVHFKDQIFGLCDNGMLVRLVLDALGSGELQVIAFKPQDVKKPQKLYLMESSENLFVVFRYTHCFPLKMRHKTVWFLVYKFKINERAWEEVSDLEDHIIFVGDGISWCIPTRNINVRSNRIYFTDDNWKYQKYPGVAYGGHDVGVFDMATGDIQQLPFGKDNPLYYSRPIWVTHTLRLD